jgi:hypothetical protein
LVSYPKTIAVIVILVLLATPTLFITPIAAQPTNQAPKIVFQKVYGDNSTAEVSNVFQTTDGGYIFADWGRSHYWNGESAIVYKTDASGNMQWNVTIPQFQGPSIIQTSDEGYELSGDTSTSAPIAIKIDSQGNIKWTGSSSQTFPTQSNSSGGSIRTSDGGYAKWVRGAIIKTDSQNNTEWIENFTAPSEHSNGFSPLPIFSVIETSDGAFAALGVGYYRDSNPYTGTIYLIKTEAFLPPPSPTQLQPPSPAPYTFEITALVSVLIIFAISIVFLIKLSEARAKKRLKNINLK